MFKSQLEKINHIFNSQSLQQYSNFYHFSQNNTPQGSHQMMKSPILGTFAKQGAGGLTRRVGCPNQPIS